VEECEDLLLGYQIIKDEREFLSEWMSRIYRFDQKAREYGQDDDLTADEDDTEREKELFSNCPVCGNGYLICKKIEDLIKDVFSHPFIPLSRSPHTRNSEVTTTPPRTLNAISISSQLRIDVAINNSVSPSRNNSVAFDGSQPLVDNDLVEGVSTDRKSSHDGDRPSDLSSKLSETVEIAVEPRDTSLHEDIVDKVISKPQSREIVHVPKPPSMEKGKRLLTKGKAVPVVVSAVPTESDGKVSLLEFYPNFCMLFPATYNQLGAR
jgi:hypothetical protein